MLATTGMSLRTVDDLYAAEEAAKRFVVPRPPPINSAFIAYTRLTFGLWLN